MESQKKVNVPLEEALTIAGSGWYTRCVIILSGLSNFAAFTSVQAMSVVVPAASCDISITSYQKGVLSSIGYFGMIFSSHLVGILADCFGRKKIIVISCIVTGIVTALSSLAPTVEALMVVFFINGFLVGGVFTPSYVYASEFCPAETRATGLTVMASCGSLVNAFLPCLAWLILPIDLHVPLFFGVVFKPWRLFLALLCLPLFLCATVFIKIPETPKFLLNVGKHDETLEVLKSIYAVNQRKPKEDFPVVSLCLDKMDQEVQDNSCKKPSRMEYVKKLVQQTVVLFTPKYLHYTLLSCAAILVLVGIYNVMILWMPEEVHQLTLFANTHSYYNVTLCDVMSSKVEVANDNQCTPNYEAYVPGVIIGLLQFIFFYIVNVLVKYIGPKVYTVFFSALAALASIVMIFTTTYYVTIFCLGAVLVLLLTMFPICLSIIVSYFPTTLRSNATSIVMLFSRIFSVIGTQVLGAAFQSNCEIAFGVISAILVGHVVLYIFMPMNIT